MKAVKISIRDMCLAALVCQAAASELAYTMLPPIMPLPAGSVAQIDIVALNPRAQPEPFELARELAGVMTAKGLAWPVILRAGGASPTAVEPGGFAVRRYQFEIPGQASDEAVLQLSPSTGMAFRAVISISADIGSHTAVTSHASVLSQLSESAPAVSAISRNFAGRFLQNQPIYLIYGDADEAAKFQFSFDYRLATFSAGTAARPSVGTLRLGYTQRSAWDLDGRSSPFYDTSYLPEFAFCSEMPMPKEPKRQFTWLGWRASVQHESNGKDGADSRSMNTVYFRPRWVLGTLGKWAFVMLPEVHAYLGDSDENPDIEGYRGYGKLRFYFGHNNGPTLMFTGWAGKDFEHGTYQLDLAVPLRVRLLNLESYLYAQYFNGHGESLRDYRRRSEALRAGFALVR